ncbi:DUF3046 domain-containing protein [Rhodococcus hoagii]|nr:DUF3046 domain-containing protein [Prescottella equi]
MGAADNVLEPPPGEGPLIVLAPSTASTGDGGMLDTAIRALDGLGGRMLVTLFETPVSNCPTGCAPLRPAGRSCGHASVVCGAGHGVLAKGLLAGVAVGDRARWRRPVGGGQSCRRQGSGVLIRPLTVDALRDGCDASSTIPPSRPPHAGLPTGLPTSPTPSRCAARSPGEPRSRAPDSTTVACVRLTEFNDLVATSSGRSVATPSSSTRDPELGGKTAADAIEAGVDPKAVWRALCDEFDVPAQRR